MNDATYELIGNDSDEPVYFTKKELKLLNGISIKFSNINRVQFNFSRKCLVYIHNYCEYYLTLSKQEKLQFGKVGMMSLKEKKSKNINIWCMNWITNPQDFNEVATFNNIYTSNNITSILGMIFANMMKKYSPEELSMLMNECLDLSDDDLDVIDCSTDWVIDWTDDVL